jgi:flagellar protein FliS
MHGYANAKRAYTEAAVMTASPERLVVMLFEGAIGFLARAEALINAGQVPQARDQLHRVSAILDELNYSLDLDQGEIALSLRSIYLFCKRQLSEARVEGDAAAVATIAKLLGELHAAFAEIADRRLAVAV